MTRLQLKERLIATLVSVGMYVLRIRGYSQNKSSEEQRSQPMIVAQSQVSGSYAVINFL